MTVYGRRNIAPGKEASVSEAQVVVMSGFKNRELSEITGNVFEDIGKKWLIIGCKDRKNERINLMTASWGMMGVLWGKPVCTVFVRPGRYTRELIDDTDIFTVSLFDEKYRRELNICGKKSGRDTDKVELCNFTPFEKDGFCAVEEAERVYLLKKIYTDRLKVDNFLDDSIDGRWYPLKDYHNVYVCEIVGVLEKE